MDRRVEWVIGVVGVGVLVHTRAHNVAFSSSFFLCTKVIEREHRKEQQPSRKLATHFNVQSRVALGLRVRPLLLQKRERIHRERERLIVYGVPVQDIELSVTHRVDKSLEHR
jgi:hypothetical protein